MIDRYGKSLLLAVALLGLSAPMVQAAPVLFVRTTGDDGADGLSPATALQSIRSAVQRLSESGGQVIVGPGTYVEGDISPRTLAGPGLLRPDALEIIADRDGRLTSELPGPVIVDAGVAGKPTGFVLLGESNIRIDGFHVRGASDAGIQVRFNTAAGTPSADVTIINCVAFANEKRGIDVRDADRVTVANNLTYNNGSTGISVGGGIRGSADAVIMQNTSVGNGIYGIFVGDGNQSAVASSNVIVLSNVTAYNGVAGIKAAPASQRTYGSAFNVSADAFEPVTSQDPTDLAADPLLANPAGAPGGLGGGELADDDFRLRAGSPALDYGPADATTVGITGSAAVDGGPDDGTVDAGYHQSNTATQLVVPAIPLVPIFVRITGSDSNGGGTADQALRTIGAAAARARAGNRVVVGAGEYREGDISLLDQSGTKHRPVEFVADHDGIWTGDQGAVIIDATGWQTAFNLLGSRYVKIDGFSVTGGRDSGIQIRARATVDGLHGADNVTVINSLVFSNGGSGILVRDSAEAAIYNNLVYANATGGVAIGGLEVGSPRARVANNTVYQNGGHGILIGSRGDQDRRGSPGALVLNNILDRNGGRSLLVTPLSLRDFSATANLDGDIVGAIGFVNPAGADGQLGGAGFLDDDFRLQQRSAGQETTSVAVDYSAGMAAPMGLHFGSTRTDLVGDEGLADAGFHYRRVGQRPVLGTLATLQARLAGVNANRLLFVAVDGDNGDGRTPANAFSTIRAAARVAMPGDTIVVAPGRYAEGDVSFNNSGTVLQPIAVVADSSGALSGTAPGRVVVDATGYDTGFVLLRRSFIQIRGFYISGAREAGIQVRACSGDGSLCATRAGSDHVTIAGNVIYSSRRGIDVIDSSDAVIFNNLIYANESTGVTVIGEVRSADGTQVTNNTLYRNGGDALLLAGTLGAPNASVVNNLIQGSGLLGVKAKPEARPTLVLSHNINLDGASAGTPPDPDDRGMDPLFVQPTGADGILGGVGFADDDLRLQAWRSPAVDAGALDAADMALSDGVARSDGVRDSGRADLGFHYDVLGPLADTAQPAVTLYVRAQAGDDRNDGRTPASALRTVARAAAQAGAGTRVFIGTGVYREGNLRPAGSGTATNPIVFVGDSTGVETGDGPGEVLIDATGWSTGFRLVGGGYVRLENLSVTGAASAGILGHAIAGLELANCKVFSNRSTGVALWRVRGASTVFNNLVYANGGDGVQLRLRRERAGAVRLANNTVYGNGGRGVWVERSGPSRRQSAVLIAHNIMHSNAVDLVVASRRATGLRLLPNLLSQAPAGDIRDGGLLVSPQLFAVPAGADGVLGGAGFADDDFRVEATSRAIDAGVDGAATWALAETTVRHDELADEGLIDLGYHYPR
ncbi:MAG: right-handed parallel beta-helix repeat-containing protein [Deltaproteobacteria bacterium]|nr:right-handed parallel beta-helix repeat-containing protein [Deltaproteobacteria bacterium]